MKNTAAKPMYAAPVTGQRRAMLNRIRARAKKFGFKPSHVRPYTLVLYAQLVNDRSALSFTVAEETRAYNQEFRLEKSDAFYCDRIALGLHKVLVISSAESPANTPIIHYPDANWFTGTNEARDLEGIFQSQLMIKTDQDIRLEKFWTRHLRFVPEQQYEPSATDPKLFQQTNKEWYDLETNFGLWGNKRNEVEIKYGDGNFGAIAGTSGSWQNYAVVMLDGFLLVRGAESVTVSDANAIFSGNL